MVRKQLGPYSKKKKKKGKKGKKSGKKGGGKKKKKWTDNSHLSLCLCCTDIETIFGNKVY